MATDLRALVALVIAGMASKRTTQVNRIYHLDRGCGNIDGKLRKLGPRIQEKPYFKPEINGGGLGGWIGCSFRALWCRFDLPVFLLEKCVVGFRWNASFKA